MSGQPRVSLKMAEKNPVIVGVLSEVRTYEDEGFRTPKEQLARRVEEVPPKVALATNVWSDGH